MEYPEGATKLDPDDLAGLKFKHISTRSQLDHLEQANIESGLLWLQRRHKIDILTLEFIKELHSKLFGQVWKWAGKFRSTEKNIGVDPRNIAIEIKKLLDDAKFWVEHVTYSPKELAVRFHHRLVYIHAFANGNGRHARIMADAILAHIFKSGPIGWAGGHNLSTMNIRRKQYITSLRAADKGDYSLLLKFINEEAKNK